LFFFFSFFFLPPLKAALSCSADEWAALVFSLAALCAWGAWFCDFSAAFDWPAARPPRVIRARFRDLGQGMAGPPLAPLIAPAGDLVRTEMRSLAVVFGPAKFPRFDSKDFSFPFRVRCVWIANSFRGHGIGGALQVVLALMLAAALSSARGELRRLGDQAPPGSRPHSVTITEFGAVGDGKTLNTVAFQNAVFYVRSFADKGGAQLYVPKGRWLTGSFNLTSHLTLYLEKGAVIIGSKVMAMGAIGDWLACNSFPCHGLLWQSSSCRYSACVGIRSAKVHALLLLVVVACM
jgi:hypothetical protein